MPPRRMRRARKPRRAGRRGRKPTVNVNRALAPIPQRFITKQKYSDTFQCSAAQLTYGFNLNSVWDPNRSGIGHQPYGFDTLATLYNRYRVIACGWRIQFNSTEAVRAVAHPCNDFPAFGNVSELVERPRSKYVVQLPNGSPQVLKGKIYIPSLVGRSKAQYMADDRYQATVDANPAEAALLMVTGQTMNDQVATVNFTIVLEYTVEYFDVKPLATS